MLYDTCDILLVRFKVIRGSGATVSILHQSMMFALCLYNLQKS